MGKAALEGRFSTRRNPAQGEMEQTPLVHTERREAGGLVNTGLLLPRHGLWHISAVQPKLTFPPRTDFQIVLEKSETTSVMGGGVPGRA